MTVLLGLMLAAPAWSQAVSPPDRAQTNNVRPTISADLDTRVKGARMWVDGKEFTDYLRTSGDTVTLVPPYNLDYGIHQVQLTTNNGRSTNWSFAIVNGNQANNGYYNNNGYINNNNNGYYSNNGYYNNNPNNNGQVYYPNNNDPYYNNNNQNTTYYPTSQDPYYDDDTAGLEDILPALLPAILNRNR